MEDRSRSIDDKYCIGRLSEMSDEEFADAMKKLYSFSGGKDAPSNYGDALKHYMRKQDVTVEELAYRTNLSTKTIQQMRNNQEYIPELKNVVAVCIGLKLMPAYSYNLIYLSGHTIRNTRQNIAYKFLVDTAYNSSNEECNYFLKRANLTPI